MAKIFFLQLCVLTGLTAGRQRESLDVLEGEEVLLQCRFGPVEAESGVTLYWIRSNKDGSDNAAIEGTSLDPAYSGQYDLKIKNTTYNRDNGNFKCMVKEAGTGRTVHTKSVGLTVLLPPAPPRISPASPVAVEGKPLNLTCSSTGGSPPPQVRWYRAGQSQLLESVLLEGGTREEGSTSVLTVTPARDTDGATYRCTVWNRALGQRQKLESRTRLQVNYFPRVTIGQHNPLSIEEGDTAVLTCQVDSKPMVDNVKWTRSGRYIATTFRHVIPTVDIEDAGPYYCEADNGLGQAGKAEVGLKVLYGPRVVVERQQEAEQGGQVEVECVARASPAPTSLVWTRVGEPEFRQTGRWLRLTNLSHSDGGEYTCTATNTVQPSGQPARSRTGNTTLTLAVRHKPGTAYIQPLQPVGIEGKSVKLVCGASPAGHPGPQYRWWRSSAPQEILSTNPSLVIRPVRLASAGEYTCQPHNTLGRGEAVSVLLEVVQEPRILSGLSNQVIRRAGDTNLNLTCLGMGKPTPTATWFKDGTEIDGINSEFFLVWTAEQRGAGGAGAAVRSVLQFEGAGRTGGDAVRPWDSGEFTCQFDNSVGRAQSAMALSVEHEPLVAHRGDKVAADRGERADLVCRMKAFPAPQFQWEREGVALSSSGLRSSRERDIKQVSDYEYESTFTIWTVKADSYGEYVCRASNSMGAGEAVVRLVRRGKPETPSAVRATETGPNSVVLAWTENFNGGMNNTSFRLQWEEQGGGRKFSRAREKRCLQGSVCMLSGLKQHTTYLLRVRAVNNHGESTWSTTTPVTTQIDVSQIPTAETIFFEKSTKSISFKVSNYPLNLIAKLEVMSLDGSWNHLRTVSLKNKPYKYSVNPLMKIQNVRVRLCLESNDLLCGAYNEASMVDKIQEAELFDSANQSWLMVVIIALLVTTLVTAILLVRCCCRQAEPKRKYMPGEVEQLGSARPDILNPSLSFHQKVSGSPGEAVQTDLYSQQAGPGYCEQSSAGSDQRGSVNSADSLWQQEPGEAGQQGELLDYAHYPRPEEYLAAGERLGWSGVKSHPTRQHNTLGNGDQYAVPSKLKPRGGDMLAAAGLHQQFQLGEQEAVWQEESLPGSTPRKVIREIIV